MFYRIELCGIVLFALFATDNSATLAMSSAGNQHQRDIFLKIPLRNEKAAPIQIADASARPDGVRLTTTWPTPTINQGDTIINTLDVYNAVAGQKIRIQNSNHGASYFTANIDTAIRAAVATVPGVTYTPVNAQQMEITLAAGTYEIPITQTVASQAISTIRRRGARSDGARFKTRLSAATASLRWSFCRYASAREPNTDILAG
jgi:hypothetical protein